MRLPRMTMRKWLIVVILSALDAALIRWLIDPGPKEIEISRATVVFVVCVLGSLPMLAPLIDFLLGLRSHRGAERREVADAKETSRGLDQPHGSIWRGAGLLWWTHAPARATAENRRGEPVEPRRVPTDEMIRPAETEPSPDEPRRPRDRDGHARRVSLDSSLSAAMRSPPLPSRVLPGPPPSMEDARPGEPASTSRTPPVPSKLLPGPIPGDGPRAE